MNAIETLKLLTAQMHLEPAEETSSSFSTTASLPTDASLCPDLSPRKKDSIVVSHAVLPGGKQISLLKTLLTSACERDCFYCPFRAGRDYRRATFKPDEFARTFMTLHQGGMVEGIFLSSGIVNGGVHTQDQLIATAEILRQRLGFRGYIHLKIMPGAEKAQVERAMQLANRVSTNLEAPNTQRLTQLAPHKQFMEELVTPLRWVDEIRRSRPAIRGWNGRWPSTVTQFVVGAVGESDLELLQTTEALHNQVHLGRAYFSAFHPIEDTPLENLPAESPLRQLRLYQSSFLLRDYGFSVEDLPFNPEGRLPLNQDPKVAWAQANLSEHPIEINRASREELLRIPGIGPRSVQAILKSRRQGDLIHVKDLYDLRRIGVNPGRAAPFILLNGKRAAQQLSLW